MSNLKYVLCILIVVSACFAATKPQTTKPSAPAQAVPKVVKAQTFELTDAAGKTRAWLGVSDDGTTMLKLLDKDGKPKILVGSDGEIKVLDAQGTTRVTAGNVKGDYGIALFDSKGTTRVDAKVTDKDEPQVSVRNSAGERVGVLCTMDDEPMFGLMDGTHDGRMQLYMNEGFPILAYWDSEGKPRSSFSLGEGGAGLLSMTSAAGDICAEISAKEERPTLILQSQKSDMAAFLGFTDDTDLSLLLQNGQKKSQIGLLLYGTDPTLAIAHENGNPAASMRIGDDGAPFVRTSDKDNVTIWKSP